jgi:hypothetical protein
MVLARNTQQEYNQNTTALQQHNSHAGTHALIPNAQATSASGHIYKYTKSSWKHNTRRQGWGETNQVSQQQQPEELTFIHFKLELETSNEFKEPLLLLSTGF